MNIRGPATCIEIITNAIFFVVTEENKVINKVTFEITWYW